MNINKYKINLQTFIKRYIMKKIALLVTMFAGLATLQSCTIEEYHEDGGAYSQVFEMTDHIDFPESANSNSITWDFQPAIYDSDNVLVYRWDGAAWVILPASYGLGDGDQISYDYDFTRYDVKVYATTNFPIDQLSNAEYNSFIRSQTFRVVVVPGGFQNKTNYSDYNATIKSLGLEEAPVKTLQLKKK